MKLKKLIIKRNAVKTVALLAAVLAVFAACDPAEETPPAITVADNSALTQEVYADNTESKSRVSFTTTDAWTSSISETEANAKSAQMRAAASPAWISIDPASGKEAGNYTIAITLETNATGADRTAIITISCAGTDIVITLTQKATKADGTAPEQYPTSGNIGSIHWQIANNTLTISGSGNIPGGTDNPWDLYNMDGRPQFEHVVIQEGITGIGQFSNGQYQGQSFYHCGFKILTYDIAASVTSISPWAFSENYNVREITWRNPNPPVFASGAYTYDNTYANHFGIYKEDYSTITLYVPAGAGSKYRSRAGLRDFNIVER